MGNNCVSGLRGLSFLKNKPENLVRAFADVFGDRIRDERDVITLTDDICDLKWEKLRNGRVIRVREIYELRGDGAMLEKSYNQHHWPPSSRGGSKTIRTPEEFHEGWHIIFLNLFKKEELRSFLKELFIFDEIHNLGFLYEIIRQVRDQKRGR